MKYVEIIADAKSVDTLAALAEQVKAFDFRPGVVGSDGMQQSRMLVRDEQVQRVLDGLQSVLGAQPTARILVLSVETALPKPDENEKGRKDSASIARESLYDDIAKGARLDFNYLVLVMLSTIVAAIGLVENDVAVVIGAMVIAPLLGPNLALSLGTALGDRVLMRKAVLTLVAGILLAVGLSLLFGMLWPAAFDSDELLSRTHADLGAIALSLASGAAATLSLTTGLSGVMVGVMVAVALLPPAVTLGMMLGNGHPELALGAGLLLAINIVCVNLSSKIVFFLKGVRPRTWLEKEKAKQAMMLYVVGWVVTLAILLVVIYLRNL
ncbi:putative hydrophobic protein (TIGR00341 family) [Thiobaca trueperi]|uniref:Putative hydrophobic protein (TIGR00341 family) n=2 Tax=Thiobaca trueperi TaxID=127458 RepID=A0A4R3N7G2_9GAMM|nr:putative hydrophobic protein (TIGR00341 family) [Thiobaca trueperi]